MTHVFISHMNHASYEGEVLVHDADAVLSPLPLKGDQGRDGFNYPGPRGPTVRPAAVPRSPCWLVSLTTLWGIKWSVSLPGRPGGSRQKGAEGEPRKLWSQGSPGSSRRAGGPGESTRPGGRDPTHQSPLLIQPTPSWFGSLSPG